MIKKKKGEDQKIPSPEELASFLVATEEGLPAGAERKLSQSIEEKAWSPDSYKVAIFVASWLVCASPYLLNCIFWILGMAATLTGGIIFSFIFFFVRFIILIVDANDLDLGEEWWGIGLAKKARATDVARMVKKEKGSGFLKLFSEDAGALHLYYDKWIKSALATGALADERTRLEKAIADIKSNIAQLKNLGLSPSTRIREKELANFGALLQELQARLRAVIKEEEEGGTSMNEGIAREVLNFMTKEERPLLLADQKGAELVADIELAYCLGNPIPEAGLGEGEENEDDGEFAISAPAPPAKGEREKGASRLKAPA